MSVVCNQCGKEIRTEAPHYEDYVSFRKEWGYFSNKDLEIHEFCLCESCYDKIVQSFAKPIIKKKNNEAI